MLRKIFAVLAFVALASQALGADDFIYGVQVFNRTIDYDMIEQGFSSIEQRDTTYDKLIEYAASIDRDILVRGASRYADMSTQSYRGWGQHGLYGMEDYLLPTFTKYGLHNIDWVLVGTFPGSTEFPDDRDMNAQIVRISNDVYCWPPEITRWKEILSKAANLAKINYPEIHINYEIWNEPDINDTARGINYWLGIRERYWQMLNEAIDSLGSGAEIINGGLVINDSNSEAGYMNDAVQALKDGKISMLAIHRHGTVKDFYNSWIKFKNETLTPENISPSKIILNESGYAIPYGDTSTAAHMEQAIHTAGKILAAKSWGLGGAVAFHLGGLTFANGANGDLLYDGDFSLIDFDGGNLSPRIGYYALKAAVRFTKGLEPSAGWDVIYDSDNENDTGFLWGFEGVDGRKTLVALKHKLSDDEIAEFFGSAGYEHEYDISGNEITKGSGSIDDGIIYLVSGFDAGNTEGNNNADGNSNTGDNNDNANDNSNADNNNDNINNTPTNNNDNTPAQTPSSSGGGCNNLAGIVGIFMAGGFFMRKNLTRLQ